MRRYLSLLQISSAHVYLTYPFVLSWSFIEAMAAGCVDRSARATPPVLEVLREGKNGWLVDFFAHKELAARLEEALARRKSLQNLRRAARATAVAHYDLKTNILPRWDALFEDLIAGRTPSSSNGPVGLAGKRRRPAFGPAVAGTRDIQDERPRARRQRNA